MTVSQDLELAELLSRHYGQPIPSAEYHVILVRRMQVTAGAARRRARMVGIWGAAACLLLVITSAWWIRTGFEHTPPAAKPAPAVASPLPTDSAFAVAPSNGASVPPAFAAPMNLRDFGPEQSLSATSLVVRVRIDGCEGTLVHYTILRPIFGETDAKSLDFDFTYGNAAMLAQFQQFSRDNFIRNNNRAPSDAELEAAVLSDRGIFKGAEEILMLQQVAGADGKVELRPKSEYARNLDKYESQIVAATQSGEFLDPTSAQSDIFRASQEQRLPGDVTADSQRDGVTAIRATLVNVDDHAATWEVTKPIIGTIGTRTVVISHDLFRLRAQAIARHAALDDATLKVPKAFAARVDAEMKRLMTGELIPHREAILVLTDCRAQGDDTRADLVGRGYEDATHKHLDQVENILLHPSDTKRL
jgi:hypothetical protein